MFTLSISCLTTSNLPWFIGLTFRVPVQYCSLQQYCKCVLTIQENESAILCLWKPFDKGNGYCISCPISNYPDTLKLTEGSTLELRGQISPQLMTFFCTHLYLPNLSHILFANPSTSPPWICRCKYAFTQLSSVQFSCSALSDSLRPHKPHHARPPCPSPIPGVYPNSCPLSRWCHPTISSSVVPFSSCPQSFPASGSFQISQLFTSGGQSIGVSASASVLPMNTKDWSPLGWTGWISLQSKGLSRVFSNTTV